MGYTVPLIFVAILAEHGLTRGGWRYSTWFSENVDIEKIMGFKAAFRGAWGRELWIQWLAASHENRGVKPPNMLIISPIGPMSHGDKWFWRLPGIVASSRDLVPRVICQRSFCLAVGPLVPNFRVDWGGTESVHTLSFRYSELLAVPVIKGMKSEEDGDFSGTCCFGVINYPQEGKAFGVRKAAAKWFPDFNPTAADWVHVFRIP